jgi:putative PIN family toxin of toxin-antitoxin system
MRVLLDANILISFLLIPHKQSPIYQVVTAGLRGEFVILLAGQLLEELARKAQGKKYLADRVTPQELKKFVRLVSELSETIPVIKEEIPAVTRDPKDDYLLAYALVGEADYLVTGDKDLLVLEQVDKVKIVTPREFITILKQSA